MSQVCYLQLCGLWDEQYFGGGGRGRGLILLLACVTIKISGGAWLIRDMVINLWFHPGRHRQLGDQLSQQSNPVWPCWGGDAKRPKSKCRKGFGKSKNLSPQHILVIWQGEAPILRKSACAHHVDEVTRCITSPSICDCHTDSYLSTIFILTNQNGFWNIDHLHPWSGSWSQYSRGLLEKMMTWMSTSSRTRWPRVAIINQKHIWDQIHATSTNSVSKNILAPLNTITPYHR